MNKASLKEILGCISGLCGLLLAGAEAPDLGVQIAANLSGLAMIAIPCLLYMRSERGQHA